MRSAGGPSELTSWSAAEGLNSYTLITLAACSLPPSLPSWRFGGAQLPLLGWPPPLALCDRLCVLITLMLVRLNWAGWLDFILLGMVESPLQLLC